MSMKNGTGMRLGITQSQTLIVIPILIVTNSYTNTKSNSNT